MGNPASAVQKRRKGITFKPLTAVVTALALLIIAEGARSWSASEPMATKKEVDVPGNIQIVYKENLLSLSLRNADLEKVLKEISAQSSMKISFNGPIKEKVTLEFVNLSLEQGLKRLLKNQNYSFVYSEKKDTANDETRYVLSRVVLAGKSTSSQRENGQIPVVSEEAHPTPRSQDFGLKEIPADLITDLLGQAPGVQEGTLKTLTERMNTSLKQINTQLIEALEQFGKGGNEDLGLEAFKKFVREAEAGKLNPVSPD